ncbi:maleylpyruvate isomerase family mycothiol-dependent enzyme [Mycolicibacterium sediminis]|uniref:Maleylpyruvate isomerase n=1 Tax=Mycolicibacterium sediminis TaxID=1286180 RepID=A0A7I7QVG3_9MYCO|nr:maleylpyruvate isomerase family mycothiol-dependent enzyme [Mycolicibacterium sediminis]BBY30338.1 maleylpyruvate isomerase [Mycolicibacterium sediminis]
MAFDALELSERVLIARRGTAYLAQRIAELTDADFGGGTLLDGWTRRHLVAHAAYNAVALCRLLDWATTGEETPMYTSAEQRHREIAEGATLNAGALRNLFAHSCARLDEKWRHLPGAAWRETVRTAQGRQVPAEETVWMRTREVWVHAVDLDNGGRFGDVPVPVLDSLLTDVIGAWRTRGDGAGLVLAVAGREPVVVHDDAAPTITVSGELPAVVRWAAGRGAIGVTAGTAGDAVAPRWL